MISYTFAPLQTGIMHAEALQQLAQQQFNEELYLLFHIEPNDNPATYCQKIKQEIANNQKKNQQIYLIKSDGKPLGFITMFPARSVNKITDCICSIWTTDDCSKTGIMQSFQDSFQRINANVSDRQIRIFWPLEHNPLTPLPVMHRKEGFSSFLTNLSASITDSISSIGSDFSLRRIHPDVNGAKIIFNLFENNREQTDKFLAGLSQLYSSVEQTTNYLIDHSRVNHLSANLSLFYCLYKGDTCIGLCQTDCDCDEAQINLLVDKNFDKRGYGSETIRLIERELFRYGIGMVKICCDTQNYASAGVIRHNKYIFEPSDDNNETFYYYHKTIDDYAQGQKVNKSLIKPIRALVRQNGIER